ncbi:site-specific recombinase XerD [Streptomyces sp. Amel2xB2]|uniref:tyrosine-type recombinase/integrase n=1 Tax=Streptomyces sp. Amel2xB2 TaxID=1305829 RepID=UPI000DC041E9|nr:site-specific integrase [Streptomyces sp. Amel2xB2]RAJ70196.1 site-specific recombinase XerD [Streptomyces sp. Amel2xB2]
MARRPSNNPRQIRSKTCGCAPCLEAHPEPERRPRRDCVGPWQARWRDPEGRQKARNFDRKSDALAHLDDVRSRVRHGTYLDTARGDITVTQWWGEWWPAHSKGRTGTRNHKESQWRTHIEPKWGQRKLISLTYMEIQGWITNEVKGHATQTKVIQLLRSILQSAVLDRRLPFNPADEVVATAEPPAKHPDDLRPPTLGQYELVRSHLPAFYRPLVDFAQESGMRWGEYTALRWQHIDHENATASVREIVVDDHGRLVRQAMPKTTAGFRTVPLSGKAMDALKAMEDVFGRTPGTSTPADGMAVEELVFRGPQGAVLNRNNFRRLWIPAIQKAGIARMVVSPETERKEWWPRVHDYRHALATRLHAAGVSEKDVQLILGQERGGRVTWLYTHGSEDSLEKVRAAIEPTRHLRAVS